MLHWSLDYCPVSSKGRAECVKDLPALGGSLQDWKPGLYYGVDDQCRIAFGSTARACSFTNSDLVSAVAAQYHKVALSHQTLMFFHFKLV